MNKTQTKCFSWCTVGTAENEHISLIIYNFQIYPQALHRATVRRDRLDKDALFCLFEKDQAFHRTAFGAEPSLLFFVTVCTASTGIHYVHANAVYIQQHIKIQEVSLIEKNMFREKSVFL